MIAHFWGFLCSLLWSFNEYYGFVKELLSNTYSLIKKVYDAIIKVTVIALDINWRPLTKMYEFNTQNHLE